MGHALAPPAPKSLAIIAKVAFGKIAAISPGEAETLLRDVTKGVNSQSITFQAYQIHKPDPNGARYVYWNASHREPEHSDGYVWPNKETYQGWSTDNRNPEADILHCFTSSGGYDPDLVSQPERPPFITRSRYFLTGSKDISVGTNGQLVLMHYTQSA